MEYSEELGESRVAPLILVVIGAIGILIIIIIASLPVLCAVTLCCRIWGAFTQRHFPANKSLMLNFSSKAAYKALQSYPPRNKTFIEQTSQNQNNHHVVRLPPEPPPPPAPVNVNRQAPVAAAIAPSVTAVVVHAPAATQSPAPVRASTPPPPKKPQPAPVAVEVATPAPARKPEPVKVVVSTPAPAKKPEPAPVVLTPAPVKTKIPTPVPTVAAAPPPPPQRAATPPKPVAIIKEQPKPVEDDNNKPKRSIVAQSTNQSQSHSKITQKSTFVVEEKPSASLLRLPLNANSSYDETPMGSVSTSRTVPTRAQPIVIEPAGPPPKPAVVASTNRNQPAKKPPLPPRKPQPVEKEPEPRPHPGLNAYERVSRQGERSLGNVPGSKAGFYPLPNKTRLKD